QTDRLAGGRRLGGGVEGLMFRPPLVQSQQFGLNERRGQYRHEFKPFRLSWQLQSMSAAEFGWIGLREKFRNRKAPLDIEHHGSGPPDSLQEQTSGRKGPNDRSRV